MFYILKHKTYESKWCYVGVTTTISNDGGVDMDFELRHERPYPFTDLFMVESILSGNYDCKWYNSSIDTPTLPDDVGKEIMKNYEVVKLVPEF